MGPALAEHESELAALELYRAGVLLDVVEEAEDDLQALEALRDCDLDVEEFDTADGARAWLL